MLHGDAARPERTTRDADVLRALADKARRGGASRTEARLIAQGQGFRIYDVVCSAGPADRPFEERHGAFSISLVLDGLFGYRGQRGAALLSPGALLLGNAGAAFECAHRHGEGDRCLSFQYAPELFEPLARAAQIGRAGFLTHQASPVQTLSPVLSRARRAPHDDGPFDELSLDLLIAVLGLHQGPAARPPTASDERRVAQALRTMLAALDQPHPLEALSRAASLSRYHFLRVFKAVTGVAPHQWLLRARLRRAAQRLAEGDAPVTEVSLEVGFQDLSNFTRAFRAELGQSPRQYRASLR